MPSSKRHTTSKSGASAKSTKKQGTSRADQSSSRTSTPSSVLTLDGNPPNPELHKLQERLQAALARLERLRAQPTPKLALYRTMRGQEISRHLRLIKQLTEAINSI